MFKKSLFFFLLMITLFLIGCSKNENYEYINSSENDYLDDDPNVDDMQNDDYIKLCAWRGCYNDYDYESNTLVQYCEENSWPSYRKALEYEFDFLWIASVNFSKDGVFYVMHDNNSNRTCNYNIELREHYSDDIDRLFLNNKGAYNWQDQDLRIPRLEDVLKFCFDNQFNYGIRLGWLPDYYNASNSIWNSALELFEQYHMPECIYSGTYDQISIIKKKHKDWNCQLLIESTLSKSDALDFVQTLNNENFNNMSVIIYNSHLSCDLVEYSHANNIRIFLVIDFVINDDFINQIKNIKVDALITNYYIEL